MYYVMSKFSIIIPTYNRKKLLEEALDSVHQQTYSDYEIIVVDDGSTDDTREYLANFKAHNLRSVFQKNQGPGAARNAGAAVATGDYIAFLDSDDLWFPYTLDIVNQATMHGNRPSVIQITHGSARHQASGSFNTLNPDFAVFNNVVSAIGSIYIMGSGATIIRRDVWNKTRGFIKDRVVGEDIAFMMQIADIGPYIMIQNPPLFTYRVHDGNTIGPMKGWRDGALAIMREYASGAFPVGEKNIEARIGRWVSRDVAYRSTECLKREGGLRTFPSLYFKQFLLQIKYHNYGFIFKSPVWWLMRLCRI